MKIEPSMIEPAGAGTEEEERGDTEQVKEDEEEARDKERKRGGRKGGEEGGRRVSERRRCLGTVHDRHVIGQDRPFRRCYSTFKKRSPSGEPRLPTPSCRFMATKMSGSSRLTLRSSSPTTPSPPAALEPGTASGMESLALLAPQRCHC